MSRLVATAWFSIATAFAVGSAPVIASPSHGFSSPAGYALRYPAEWTRVEASPERLLILSHGKRVQGPVIGPSQAAILVRILGDDEPIPPAATRAKLPKTAFGSCRKWLERETRDASDPGPVEISRSLYCVGEARTVLVQLTHWADDPHQASYRRAASNVAASLRLVEVSGARQSGAYHR